MQNQMQPNFNPQNQGQLIPQMPDQNGGFNFNNQIYRSPNQPYQNVRFFNLNFLILAYFY